MSDKKPVSDLPLSKKANSSRPVSKIEPMDVEQTFDANPTSSSFEFSKLCNNIMDPSPIPTTVVPIFATDAEREQYENMFAQSLTNLEDETVSDLLSPFYMVGAPPLKASTAKPLFISHLLKAIRSSKKENITIAILCKDEDTESRWECSTLFQLHTKKVPLSRMFPDANLYGFMIKYHKAQNLHPEDNKVDAMIAFDSACNIDHPEAFNHLASKNGGPPKLVNICVVDSPDYRIYCHNKANPTSQIDWDTKISEIDEVTRNNVLYQPNRSCKDLGENNYPYVANLHKKQLAEWLFEKTQDDFRYKLPEAFPKKLIKAFQSQIPAFVILPAPKIQHTLDKSAPPVVSHTQATQVVDNIRINRAVSSPTASPATPSPVDSSSRWSRKESSFKRKYDCSDEVKKLIKAKKAALAPANVPVSSFIPDLEAKPRQPRPTNTATSKSIDLPSSSSSSSDRQLTVPTNSDPPLTVPAETKATTNNNDKAYKFGSVFDQAIAQLERDLDAIKEKLCSST